MILVRPKKTAVQTCRSSRNTHLSYRRPPHPPPWLLLRCIPNQPSPISTSTSTMAVAGEGQDRKRCSPTTTASSTFPHPFLSISAVGTRKERIRRNSSSPSSSLACRRRQCLSVLLHPLLGSASVCSRVDRENDAIPKSELLPDKMWILHRDSI